LPLRRLIFSSFSLLKILPIRPSFHAFHVMPHTYNIFHSHYYFHYQPPNSSALILILLRDIDYIECDDIVHFE
jgi:hypothetical protein